ncbi:MAG: outer membrane beta-barrel protein [Bdellovibrionota bacterium]
MMKRTFCALAVVLFTSATFAQTMADKWRDGTSTVRGLIGSTQGAINAGVDYERRMGNAGVGGFFIWSDEDDDTNRAEKMFLGLQAVIHVIDRTEFDVYVAPGLTVVMHDEPPAGGDDETSFGPSMRLGAIYYFNQNWGLGFDWLKTHNWSSDDVGFTEELSNLAVSYTY